MGGMLLEQLTREDVRSYRLCLETTQDECRAGDAIDDDVRDAETLIARICSQDRARRGASADHGALHIPP
jgi:hypothetical protein